MLRSGAVVLVEGLPFVGSGEVRVGLLSAARLAGADPVLMLGA
jgi:hypothetical protein